MNSKIYYYLSVGFLVLLVVGAGVGFYYAAFGDLSFLFGKDEAAQTKPVSPTGLRLSSDGTLYFAWEKLPNGTTAVNIYRARKGTQDWKLWKTVQITGDLEKGLLQLQNSGTEKLSDFDFYYEAINGDGATLWKSEIDEISPYTPPREDLVNPNPNSTSTNTTSTTSTNTSSNNNNPPPNNSTSTEEVSSSTPPTNQTSTPPGEGITSYPSGTIVYYTPSGEVSGTRLYDTSFWAEIVNNKIQLGWQNLPSNTTELIIERSSDSTGPWTTILYQEKPEIIGPYTISLLDAAVSSPFHYRLRSFIDGSELISLGPLYIEQ